MKPPSLSDRCIKVTAYLTDEVFGYEHWRAAQFSSPPASDKYPALLMVFDTEAARDAANAHVHIDGYALASAMKKLLPPELLAEVIAHLDPLTPFLNALRALR